MRETTSGSHACGSTPFFATSTEASIQVRLTAIVYNLKRASSPRRRRDFRRNTNERSAPSKSAPADREKSETSAYSKKERNPRTGLMTTLENANVVFLPHHP
jgi:hypothetical protein